MMNLRFVREIWFIMALPLGSGHDRDGRIKVLRAVPPLGPGGFVILGPSGVSLIGGDSHVRSLTPEVA
jgi:hypothetical protein